MSALLRVTSDRGVTFNVRRVDQGESYGLNDCLTHKEADPLIEFWDSRWATGVRPLGQFVSRYYASTLRGHAGGLDLHGGEPSWQVSAANMQTVQELL